MRRFLPTFLSIATLIIVFAVFLSAVFPDGLRPAEGSRSDLSCSGPVRVRDSSDRHLRETYAFSVWQCASRDLVCGVTAQAISCVRR